jgi:REP element-mobilizing transposase RayT
MPEPIYDPARVDPAYQLRYVWTGWPSAGTFRDMPTDVVAEIAPLWEQDGLRVLEHRWTSSHIQLLFSTTPSVSPTLLAGRAKGRLDHALRTSGAPIDFSRKIAVRSLGDTTRREVEAYIERQVGKEHFVDPRFERVMQQFTVVDPTVDLSAPASSARGRYWYNLHLVLVVEQRDRVFDQACLTTIRDTSFRLARKKGYGISRLAVMPDHLHVALRGDHAQSPNEIVHAFQNDLAYAIGQRHLWEDTFYVGTFGEYDMDAVRRQV